MVKEIEQLREDLKSEKWPVIETSNLRRTIEDLDVLP